MTSEEFNVHKELKLARMAEITAEQKKLNDEYSELEAFFMKKAVADLENTKQKSVTYIGSSARIMATMAQALKVESYPSLKPILGKNYANDVTESISYRLSEPVKRMLIGIKTGGYIIKKASQFISELDCDDKTKKALCKKIKGINPITDRDNFMKIAGFSYGDAEFAAYFVYEATIWEQFERLLLVNEMTTVAEIEKVINLIKGAVVVEETPRLTFTLNE